MLQLNLSKRNRQNGYRYFTIISLAVSGYLFCPTISLAQSTVPSDMVVVCPTASEPSCGCNVFADILSELRQIKSRLPEPTQPTPTNIPIPAPTAILTTSSTTTTTTETTTTTVDTSAWSRLSPADYWHQFRYGW